MGWRAPKPAASEVGEVNAFETLKERVPVEEVVGHHSEVKGSKARCVAPDHPDANPSMHLYGEHVHCFACGFHGDVTDVWAAMKGFERPIEAELDLAREYGVELPEQDPEAKRCAQERREQEDRYLNQARACHAVLSQHTRVAMWWEGRGFDEGLRERFLLGTNRDGTAAVIPYWNRGRVQGLVRRNLEGEPKYLCPEAREFPGGHKPLFVPGRVRDGAFLVEGFVDALALAALGESAIAVGGTRISEEQMRALRSVPAPLYILPDADEEGTKAARQWARRLYPKALVCPAEYGSKEVVNA
jgi:DNA primase